MWMDGCGVQYWVGGRAWYEEKLEVEKEEKKCVSVEFDPTSLNPLLARPPHQSVVYTSVGHSCSRICGD